MCVSRPEKRKNASSGTSILSGRSNLKKQEIVEDYA
jgi:hypothetical protein